MFSQAPSVADVTIHVTFVDNSGNRTRVPGRIGQSILDTARLHKLPMDGMSNDSSPHAIKQSDEWTEDVFGEGPYTCNSHVLVAPEWVDRVPKPLSAEIERLEALDEELTAHSRLGESITLTKDLDGLVVYLPAYPPTDIP